MSKYYLRFWYRYYKDFVKSIIKRNRVVGISNFSDVGILNPGIGTTNLGDHIIYKSVREELERLMPNAMFTDYPTQLRLDFDSLRKMQAKDLLIVSGTNLLSGNMESVNQWKIHQGQVRFLRNRVVLMGCGWWQYQDKINSYTANLYREVLSRDVLHSVRDEYTKLKLNSIGIDNVVNTSCPTAWKLSKEHCRTIPSMKKENVVTTLTFYHKCKEKDKRLIEILIKNYETVYLWIQGLEDLAYLDELGLGNCEIKIVPPSVNAYTELLKTNEVDYIGTRLHAGIRALQLRVRSLILAVDNRAIELGQDIGLNVIDRNEVEAVTSFIEKPYETEIHLPEIRIKEWMDSVNLFLNKEL